MQVQLKPWGNSQGIRLSKDILASANFKPDDVLDVKVEAGSIILSKQFRHRTLRERAAAYNGNLNLSEEFDWGEPRGNEVW